MLVTCVASLFGGVHAIGVHFYVEAIGLWRLYPFLTLMVCVHLCLERGMMSSDLQCSFDLAGIR